MNERQLKIKTVIDDIYRNDDDYPEEYYGIQCSKYENLEYYFNKHSINNLYDRIAISQNGMNFEIVKMEFEKVKLSQEANEKLQRLMEINENWYETLNPEILSSKYDFLNGILDYIITDINIQQQIIGLDDGKLILFEKLLKKLQDNTEYPIPYISRILTSISYTPFSPLMMVSSYNSQVISKYDNLASYFGDYLLKGNELNGKDVEILLFIMSSNNQNWEISSIDDLRNFKSDIDKNIDDYISYFKVMNTISQDDLYILKSALLTRKYGIDYDYAKYLLEKYDMSGIEVSDFNNEYSLMYHSIVEIVNENNPDVLFNIYSKMKQDNFNYMTTILFESGMREIFAKNLNNVAFKCENKDYTLVDGVKVYDAGVDFKIILTSVGAYQPNLNIGLDYMDYWNSRQIRSHGNCCSLISNNNLSTAEIRNICLGFNDFKESMLLLCGNNDINSTPTSRKLNTFDSASLAFMAPSKLIDNTRGDYNELVYERRDLNKDRKHYKKNPDYVIMFEEFDNISENELTNEQRIILTKEKENKLRAIKAAKDFNIPIVKINREKCARHSFETINQYLTDYLKNNNSEYIKKIIIEFENNRVGLRDPHSIIREKYFSKEIMNSILNKIIGNINLITDYEIRNDNIRLLEETILTEKSKVDVARKYRKFNQESAINFEEILENIKILKQNEQTDVVNKMIDDMVSGKLDVNGQPLNQNEPSIKPHSMGFAKIWLLIIITSILSLVIMILGALINNT